MNTKQAENPFSSQDKCCSLSLYFPKSRKLKEETENRYSILVPVLNLNLFVSFGIYDLDYL